MSRFTQPLDVRHTAKRPYEFMLLHDLPWEVGGSDSNEWIVIPNGFRSDGASVPRVLWSFLPTIGRYLAAAFLHDYLYTLLRTRTPHPQVTTRRQADHEFYVAMKVLGVGPITRIVMWGAVRCFGWIYVG